MHRCVGLVIPLILLAGCAVDEDLCITQPDVCAYRVFEQDLPTSVAGAAARVRLVQDPIVRNAMVMLWVEENNDAPMEATMALCGLLATNDARACTRRVGSAHLRR